MSSLILKIAEKMDGQRSLNGCLHVLRGKRSGQTLQDADTFSVKPYFSLLPKLSEAAFTEAAGALRSRGLLAEKEGLLELTDAGREAAAALPEYRFDGWNYRGREAVFFQRLQLVVQTFSQLRDGQNSFLPITNDRTVQQFVRRLIPVKKESWPETAGQLAEELIAAIRASGMSDLQAALFSHRLTGAGATGWTWEQLEEAAGEPRNSLQLEWLEALHRLLAIAETPQAENAMPHLHKLSESIRVETPLTGSAAATKKLFDKGYSLEEISRARQLKTSTIEDHFTEMAANVPGFPIGLFVTEDDQQAVRLMVSDGDVKRLRLLKEAFPHLSYFQLRLVLSTMKGEPPV
ncbi:helix-turn-helix domain-containing protein [Sporosarcina sp. NCCP-2716]|uniref:helix-turn-helix domain-containing protein n=1 Tax=Sporosarcina sp. NCCP-2716 TaxID=2943679 RepID=UPI00203D75C3|nr:helix-turn-helix domain-containing protein [Sporosarcina sp. NCCP-2716]